MLHAPIRSGSKPPLPSLFAGAAISRAAMAQRAMIVTIGGAVSLRRRYASRR